MIAMSVNTAQENVRTIVPVFDDFVALAPLSDLLGPLPDSDGAERRATLWHLSAEALRSAGALIQAAPVWIEDDGRLVLVFAARHPGLYISFSSRGVRSGRHIPKDEFGETVADACPWLRASLPNASLCEGPVDFAGVSPLPADRIESLQRELDNRHLMAFQLFQGASAQPRLRAFLEADSLSDSAPIPSSPPKPKKSL